MISTPVIGKQNVYNYSHQAELDGLRNSHAEEESYDEEHEQPEHQPRGEDACSMCEDEQVCRV